MKAAIRDMKVSEWKLGSCSTAQARSMGIVGEGEKWGVLRRPCSLRAQWQRKRYMSRRQAPHQRLQLAVLGRRARHSSRWGGSAYLDQDEMAGGKHNNPSREALQGARAHQ